MTPTTSYFLSTPNTGTTTANGINNRWGMFGGGIICGVVEDMPCYWDGNGNLHRLTPAADATTNPLEINYTSGVFQRVNDRGQMVGCLQVNGRGQTAAIHQRGQFILLEDLIVAGQATLLSSATDINDCGQILAPTSSNDRVLLSPVYLADGAFSVDSLSTNGLVSGPGSAAPFDLGEGDYCVQMTAGSPVTLAQNVATPVGTFELTFDCEFLTTDPTASLYVTLNGELIGSLSAPPTRVGQFTNHRIEVTDLDLLGLDQVPLVLTYDGPAGTQVLIDNIQIVQSTPSPPRGC